ncbi:hypothetical protein MIFL109517_09580 [Micrococcus flavus]
MISPMVSRPTRSSGFSVNTPLLLNRSTNSSERRPPGFTTATSTSGWAAETECLMEFATQFPRVVSALRVPPAFQVPPASRRFW